MKDAGPRIFRTLEKTGGRDGFDTIVGAAVLSYGSLRAPNDTQARDFARLVVPLWDKVSADTRRSLAASLSKSVRVPRDIVERLIAEPIEVSAPFLMSSPALGEAELKALALGPDRRLRKLIGERLRAPGTAAARSAASAKAADRATAGDPIDVPPSAGTADPDAAQAPTAPFVHTGTDTPRRAGGSDAIAGAPPQPSPAGQASRRENRPEAPMASPPLVPDLLAPAPSRPPRQVEAADRGAAALVRDTLLRLALPGRRKPATDGADGPPPSLRELVAIAVQQDAARFYDGLAGMLALASDRVRQIATDDTGERLAVAVKALGASPADALTILMMMKPSIGLDVEAFERMTKYYRALKAADCTALARGTPQRQTASAPALQAQYQDLAPLPRAEARPSFGRRLTAPGEARSGKRSA